MKVEQLMTRTVETCRPTDALNAAARIMWEKDCGCVPVVTEEEGGARVVGMLTDRDICIGLATRGRTASHVAAREVMSSTLHACFPDDEITMALEMMKTSKVRRLPVIDGDGHLKGILSLNDIVLRSRPRAASSPDRVVDALKSICEHRRDKELVRATA